MRRENGRRAVILGGTGAIGFAVGRRLLASGWSVDVTGRDAAHMPPELAEGGARFVSAAREDEASLHALLGAGADLLVDCACYTAAHAQALLPLLGGVGATVMISSKAVYVDAAGRHSNSAEPPQFPGPIREDQATLPPTDAPFASAEGYGAHKAAAEAVLLDSAFPVTVLRPSKVHGAWARRPREWMFVRRVLDGRRPLILRRRGAGIDHPSAAANVAALVELAARLPGRRVLNAADPDAPCGLDIARVVAAHLGHRFDERLLDGGAEAAVGRHPWDAVPPVILDMSVASRLGYAPVGDYAATVTEEIDWLVRTVRSGATAWAVPAADDPFFAPLCDYAVEDRFLAAGDGPRAEPAPTAS